MGFPSILKRKNPDEYDPDQPVAAIEKMVPPQVDNFKRDENGGLMIFCPKCGTRIVNADRTYFPRVGTKTMFVCDCCQEGFIISVYKRTVRLGQATYDLLGDLTLG